MRTHHFTSPARPGYAAGLILVLLVGMAIGLFVMFGPTGKGGKSAAKTMVDSKTYAEEMVLGTFNAQAIYKDVQIFHLTENRFPADQAELEQTLGRTYEHDGDPYRITFTPDGRDAVIVHVRHMGRDGVWDSEDDITDEQRVSF